MSCKICGRGACASWMHSIKEQEKYDERETMTDDVDTLRREVQDLRGEVAELKAENDKLRESHNAQAHLPPPDSDGGAPGSEASWKLTWVSKGWVNGHCQPDMTLAAAVEMLKVLADDPDLEISLIRDGVFPTDDQPVTYET